jgi:hypothetical protein
LGVPWPKIRRGVAVGVVPRQHAVEAHGVLEVREAEQVEAPGVLGRVAGGLIFGDGTREHVVPMGLMKRFSKPPLG